MKSSLFGTDGIRQLVGTSPFTLEHAVILGNVIARWVQEKSLVNNRVLIAHDPRLSSYCFKAALKAGLLSRSLSVVDALVLTTPAFCKLMQKQFFGTFCAGIMITASHNTYEYNGIKLVDGNGRKISYDDQERITALFDKQKTNPCVLIDYRSCGKESLWTDAAQEYINLIISSFPVKFLEGTTIVIDCSHGATSVVAPKIFEQLGARVITINNSPNGKNINVACGALHPEQVQQAVLAHKAHIGFAFDGDGDRIVAVNNDGTIIDGDHILALLIDHPLYQSTPAVVTTILSNGGLHAYLQTKSRSYIQSNVGDIQVLNKLEQHNLLLGAEPSGHIIMRNYLDSSDGIFVALRILEVLLMTNNWSMETFKAYPQAVFNIPINTRYPLTQEPLASIVANYQQQIPNGKLVVRYSGTENLLRIMVEDQYHAHTVGQELFHELRAFFNNAVIPDSRQHHPDS